MFASNHNLTNQDQDSQDDLQFSSDKISSLLKSLNDQQLQAVKTTEGPLLVLAGAGTGKTKVLTSRIVNILANSLAYPSQILAVTFTNKAAQEMKKRIGEIVGDQVNNIWVGTFHAICAKILRRHPEVVGLRPDFTIIDDDDQTRLLKQILIDFNIDIKQFAPKAYLNKISRLKDSLKTPANADDLALPKLKDVFETYQFRLRSMNSADFGDLIALNLQIFNNDPEVLAYYQNKFRYVLIDEYQDTNDAQYRWLLQLSLINQNICCVGDDDQSIYSWRGANIANILRFEKDFSDAKVIRLEQNYRSTTRILNSAHHIISNNKQRHGKKLWTELGQGEKIKVFAYNDDRLEALMTANKIKDSLSNKKVKPNEIAVLVRAGHQTRAFEEAFMQNNIAYRVIGGMKFYERMEIRDSIAYLRVVANPDDDLALSRIINVPKRGIGETALANFFSQAKEQKIPLMQVIKNAIASNELKGKGKESLTNLITIFDQFNKQIASETLINIARNLLTQTGYLAMWKSENTVESQGRIENIEEFISTLSDFANITEFLEYASLVEARDEKNLQEAITIMTVHGAKGLEFEMVFLPGLEDGIFPSSKSLDEKTGLEEERRLMYVAITRAKKYLTISFAKSRYMYGDVQFSMPSRFIKELNEDEIDFEEISFGNNFYGKNNNYKNDKFDDEFSQDFDYEDKKTKPALYSKNFGQSAFVKKSSNQYYQASKPDSTDQDSMLNQRVFHQKFGYGKVVKVDDKKLEIIFEKAGTKIVLKDFVSIA